MHLKDEKNQEMSALDAYINRVFKIVIMAPSTAAMMAAICFTIFKFTGLYEDVPMIALVVFDCTNIFYLVTSIYFFLTGIGEDGVLKQNKLKNGKRFVTMVILVQWNFISYLIPAREWWAFSFFFVGLAVFFFDMKMMSIATGGVVLSTILSWISRADELFVAEGAYFLPDVILRFICVCLTMLLLLGLTYFGGRFLVEELEKFANYDTLTHLLNRRSMNNYLQEAYQQAQTGRSSFCLLMGDIDDFKKVNDTYGHDCGDEVLKYVAQTIATGVKKNDNVFRWGGEEICILLKTDEEKAVAAAERIRADIARDPVDYRNKAQVSITITMGVSAYRDGMTIQAMMEDADEKLYWGKKHGKNQVVSRLPDNPEPPAKKTSIKKESQKEPQILKFSLRPRRV